MNSKASIVSILIGIMVVLAIGAIVYVRSKNEAVRSVNQQDNKPPKTQTTENNKEPESKVVNPYLNQDAPRLQGEGGDYKPPVQQKGEELKPNPKYVVSPVQWQEEPSQEEAKGQKGYLAMPGGGWAFFEAGNRRVVVPGYIINRAGEMEFFAVADGGKDYESVMKLFCDAVNLNFALTLACMLKKGSIPTKLDISDKNQGDRVIVLVQWKDKDGKVITHRAEDLVLDRTQGSPMPRVGFTYTGSYFIDEIDPDTNKPTGRTSFAAGVWKTIITTIRDSSALLDNPLPEALDHIGVLANWSVLPPSGTPIKVIFRPPTQAEKDEISQLEKKLNEVK